MAPKKGGNLYEKSKPIATGTVLTDFSKTKWKIFEKIGQGGFADVYAAKKLSESNDTDDVNNYAIKVEPQANGPLFSEMHFFSKFLKPSVLRNWQQSNNLPFLGVPEYYGSGYYNVEGFEHRFLVMNRFGDSITSQIRQSGRINLSNVSVFLQQIVDALQFIHSNDYVHGDIKAENLLLKYSRNSDYNTKQIYLIDYSLVNRCYQNENIVINKKCSHNGTILFCSRDAHLGISTKRSDLESLGYNALIWFDYKPSWTDVTSPEVVKLKKEEFMENLAVELNGSVIPKQLIDFLSYVNTLHHLQTPDYEYVKQLFKSIDNVGEKPIRGQQTKKNIIGKRKNISNGDANGRSNGISAASRKTPKKIEQSDRVTRSSKSRE